MTHLHRGASGAGLVEIPPRTQASQCVAVDRQRVQQHLRMGAIVVRALQVRGGVVDQSPVAVRRARGALTAIVSHEPLLASPHVAMPMPRRSP